MRLDASVLRYLTRDDFRVLTAIEMGMKNHELVPTPLICSIAALQAGPGAAFKIINTLHRNKLIYHESKKYDGYRLTYLGYDYLALRTYVARGLISGLGRRIGVGKEADIYECTNEAGEIMVLKIHRLGRISFRQIKNKRDYLLHRKNASWMYMSRLAAIREFTYMKALYDHGFPVPVPYDQSRHTILMSFIDAFPFGQVREISHTGKVYSELLNLIVRLAEHGLIHADFNEFNLLIDQSEKITLIDFPQMVSTRHPDAQEFFQRDVGCITRYFSKRFGYLAGEFPQLSRDVDESKRIDLDKELAASGHAFNFASENQRKEFELYIGGKTDGRNVIATGDAEGEAQSEEEEDEEEEEEEDEVGEDEEKLVESLGISAEDVAAGDADASAEEIERLRAGVDGEFKEDDEAAAKRAKKGAAASSSSSSKAPAKGDKKKSKKKDEDDEEEDEAGEGDDAVSDIDSEAEEAARKERMARKDARQRSYQQSQQLKASRKAAEKERKRREREGLPPLESAASSSSITATAAALAAHNRSQGDEESKDEVDDDDEEEEEEDDRRSVASSMALSQLGLGGKSVLNIQLPKPQIRLKKTNRNKDREKKKIHASIKEHM